MKIDNFLIIKFDKVTSTMDVIKNYLDKKGKVIVWAEEQTTGRGRYGREWLSPKGGLYFSFFVRKNNITDFISEIVALSLIKTLINFGINDCKIKFPNDIIIRGKKISGILIEKSGNFYIIGIGINVKMNEIFKKFNYITMEELTKKNIKIEEVLVNFFKNFGEMVKLFEEDIEYGLKIWSENLIK